MDKVTELEIRTLCFSYATTHFEPFRFATRPNSVFQQIAELLSQFLLVLVFNEAS